MEKNLNFNEKKSGEKSLFGITTGTGAAAAAKAALIALNEDLEKVNVKTKLGDLLIQVESSQKISTTQGRASVIKKSYQDPDVTRNLEIFADVEITENPGIIIKGGQGVGMITKPGLQVPVGLPAINPVPQEMIKDNLQEILPPNKGAVVTISVPGGKKLAEKTLNPRLGIKGGISILGTTGIARSMSSDSYKKSFKCQLDVALAEGFRELVFVPGNIGEDIARRILEVENDQIIQMGNFVGYMLQEAAKAGLEKLTLLGHAGKIIKISAGIFNTEHSKADGRREIIAAHAGLSGVKREILKKIFNSNTTEDMVTILERENLVEEVFNSIARFIKKRCLDNYQIQVDVVIVNMDGIVLNSNHLIKVKNLRNN